MTRWKAARIHLAISLTVVGLIVILLLLTWYPPAYVRMGKLGLLIGVLAGVDVTLGPMLTLLVFRSGKPKLKLDLTIIALLQVMALSYGLNVLWQSRPVFLVAVPDRFELVYANEIDPADLAAGRRPEFRTLSITGPVLVGAQLPIDPDERMALAMGGRDGKDIQALPKYYVPYSQIAPTLVDHALPLSATSDSPEALVAALVAKAKAMNRNPVELGYVPISSRRGNASMLLVMGSGTVVAVVDADPWARSSGTK